MKKFTFKSALIVLLMGASFASYSQIISTFAGNGYGAGSGDVTGGYTGDGGQATAAELFAPVDVAVDDNGNIYIADALNNRVRIVNTSGIINTIAGNGVAGYTGNGGSATAAELDDPRDVRVDASGNIYIAERLNSVIRLVNTSGVISTFAGNGVAGYTGDGGPATAAELDNCEGVALIGGNVYIGDLENSVVREVNSSGTISTFAGNGVTGNSGDGGPATAAELGGPIGVAKDNSGNIYIGDISNSDVRKVNTSGIISTYAGNGIAGYSGDGGSAAAAELDGLSRLILDASANLYIADNGNNVIRAVSILSGDIITLAGNGVAGYSGDGGLSTSPAVELDYPSGVAVDASGNVYIADQENNVIRKVTSSNILGISKLSSAPDEVNVYPVPNTGYFTVSGVTQGQVIELYNYLGQQIANSCQLMANSQPIHFNISNYANGIYLIRILNKDGTVVTQKKIVKTE